MASESSSAWRIAATVVAIGAAASLVAAAARPKKQQQEEETWESHITGHGDLQEIWKDTLYVIEAKGCSNGPPSRNMVLYKVPDGRLVVYNGIAVDSDTTLKQIEALGTPTILIIPNYYHRCCAAVWKQKYPEIKVVCPKVAQDHANEVVPVDFTMEEWSEMPEWNDFISINTIEGWGDFEVVLQVKLSPPNKKAMIVCDMLFTMTHDGNGGLMMKFMEWMFDSCVDDNQGPLVIPKVARLSRIFAIQDWKKAEQWYRTYAKENGKNIGAIVVGHGVVVKEVDPKEGCTVALEGVADQLTKPRW